MRATCCARPAAIHCIAQHEGHRLNRRGTFQERDVRAVFLLKKGHLDKQIGKSVRKRRTSCWSLTLGETN